MRVLIATISTGKGTWGHVSRLLREDWDKVYLIASEFAKERFDPGREVEWIVVGRRGLAGMVEQITTGLSSLPKGEVYVNLVSGSGREHMALLIALKNLGIRYGFTVVTSEGVQLI